jgi:hypothetical protein
MMTARPWGPFLSSREENDCPTVWIQLAKLAALALCRAEIHHLTPREWLLSRSVTAAEIASEKGEHSTLAS